MGANPTFSGMSRELPQEALPGYPPPRRAGRPPAPPDLPAARPSARRPPIGALVRRPPCLPLQTLRRFRLRLPQLSSSQSLKIGNSFALFNVTMRPVLPWLYFNDLETTKTTYVHHFPTLRMTFWLSRLKLFAKNDPFITLEFVKIKYI